MEGVSETAQRKYDKINIEVRQKLVHEVVEEQRSLSKTAKKLGIKLSTAKVIVKRFKEEGTYFERKKDKENRLRGEHRTQSPIQNQEESENNSQEHRIMEQTIPFYNPWNNVFLTQFPTFMPFQSSSFNPYPFFLIPHFE